MQRSNKLVGVKKRRLVMTRRGIKTLSGTPLAVDVGIKVVKSDHTVLIFCRVSAHSTAKIIKAYVSLQARTLSLTRPNSDYIPLG